MAHPIKTRRSPALSVVLLALAWTAAAPPTALAKPMRLSVRGATYKPFPVAVADLVAQDGAAADLAAGATALLRADIDLPRAIEQVPPRTFLAADTPLDQPPGLADWSNIGAAGLVRGGIARGRGQVTMTLAFWDVAAGNARLERTCQAPAERPADCIHPFVDEVVRLLTGEAGIFSSRIAFVAREGRAKVVVTVDPDGLDLQRHTEPTGLNLLPSWDPTGAYLLFTSFAEGNPDLYRLVLRGGAPERISGRRGLNTGGVVSPDGRTLAVTLSKRGNTQIFLMDTKGVIQRPISPDVGQNVSPTWSPDGRRIAFVSSASGAPHLYVAELSGGRPRRLTFQGTYNQEPDWSPRPGGQIAFTARDEQYKYDVFLVHPDTGQITRLTQEDGHNDSPSHSPDGQHLAFTSTRAGGGKRLMIMDVDGQNAKAVPGVAQVEAETPAWGPRLGSR